MPAAYPVILLLALALAGPTVASTPAANPRLADVRTFALAIGGDAANSDLSGYDLVVVDNSTPADHVAQLRAAGSIVLAYLDIGTIEPYRPWFGRTRHYRMDYWPEWKEWYARVARPGYRDLLARTVAPRILRKGFDGLFLDNVDMIETHPHQTRGMLELVRRLARLRGYLFAQNGDDVIKPFAGLLDGWNREDVSRTYDVRSKSYVPVDSADVREAQSAIRRMRRRGLLVTATDYVAPGDSAAAAAARATACSAGALSYVSDIELDAVPQPPSHC